MHFCHFCTTSAPLQRWFKEVQRCRDAGMQRCRGDAEMQRCRGGWCRGGWCRGVAEVKQRWCRVEVQMWFRVGAE
jgi:hypothetical protein